MSTTSGHTPLAIIGMACRLPGGDGLDDFWSLLRSGGDAVGEFPADRLDRELYYSSTRGRRGKTYSTLGGMIADRPLDEFVRSLPAEMREAADPCHLILCETAARAIAHAGYDPKSLATRNIGVYVGHSGGSSAGGEASMGSMVADIVGRLDNTKAFGELTAAQREQVREESIRDLLASRSVRADGGLSLQANAAASLLARAFGLDGPQYVIDAACASSLVALQAASAALENDRIDAALVCGASYNKSDSLVLFSHAQSCSATGSRPFDATADGLIGSEGYVVLAVKTLARARADGDTIHAVIRGIGVSSDGRGRSLWAPRKEGQLEAVRRAYDAAVDPTTIQYVEMHATSTQVGDATEISALAAFFADRPPKGPIPIGSVKSNIGHTLETAGLAGLLKTVLAMKHRVIPASIHVGELNRNVDWANTRLEVVRNATSWPEPRAGVPRRAAVNAFGIGGLNVHVVLEEFDAVGAYAAPQRVRRGGGEAVAIVGRGAVLPGAFTLQAFRELCRSQRDARSEAPRSRWNARLALDADHFGRPRILNALGGFLREYRYDWRRHKIPPKQLETANLLQFLLLDAADQALDEARESAAPADGSRTGVVIGTIFGGDFSNQLQVGLRLPEIRRAVERAAAQCGVSPAATREFFAEFEERLLIDMPALIDETGSFTSSTLASRLTKTFDLMGGALAVDAGECSGAAALALAVELLLTGKNDAVLCAGAQRAMGLPAYETLTLAGRLAAPGSRRGEGHVPGEGTVVLFLKRLSDAQRDGNRVFGILREAGVSFAENNPRAAVASAARRAAKSPFDATLRPVAYGLAKLDGALNAGLDGAYPHARTLQLPSPVELIGHTQAAHGLVDLVQTTFEFEQSSVNAEENVPDAAALTSATCVGLSYHFVMENPRPIPKQPAAIAEVPTRVPSPSPVVSHVRTLPAVGGRVVGVFAGQAAQYPGMVKALASADPVVGAFLKEADENLACFGLPSFGQFAWGDATGLGTDVRLTQLAMLIADLAYDRALTARGVRYDWAAGHSYGEIAALTAAGCWTLKQAIELTLRRSEAVLDCHCPASAMLAVSASPMELQPLIASQRVELYFTHHNAPQQTVLAGEQRTVQQFAEVLKNSGYDCRTIDVPRPFHSPMLKGAASAFKKALQNAPIRPPVVPVLSGVTNRFVTEPDEIRENLARQLTQPLRYVELVQRLQREGARLIIEVGPNSVLTNLHRQILTGLPVESIACDDRSQSSTAQLDRAAELHRQMRGTSSAESVIINAVTSVPRPGLAAGRPALTAEAAPVVAFDATADRRRRARDAATSKLAEPIAARNESRQPNASPDAVVPATVEPEETRDSGARRSQPNLAAFLVSFVVEQTGYPPEIVDLDADLEADLGIDSIKKAQLFGELREFFELPPREELRLSEFPTLRHVERLLSRGQGKNEWLSPATNESATTDSGTATIPASLDTPQNETYEKLQRFLVNFVVEQTGYPIEVVDLDADLEADLGIDSIKKAQILGELREHFSSSDAASFKPIDFPTLRHILNRFAEVNAAPTPVNVATVPVMSAVSEAGDARGPAVAAAIPAATTSGSDVWESQIRANCRGAALLLLSGTPYEMGREHGIRHGTEIRKILRRHVDLSGPEIPLPRDLLRPDRLRQFYSAEEMEELEGVADGAGVAVANLLAHNLALTFDSGAGCVQFAMTAEENGTLIHAANEDSPWTLTMRDCLRGIVQIRRAGEGREFATFTVVGQTAGINGLNSAGLSVTSTKLLERPLRISGDILGKTPTHTHSTLVKHVLARAGDLNEALSIIREFPRMGSWSMCLGHRGADRLAYVEYDGELLEVRQGMPRVASANHSLIAAPGPEVPEHSKHRLSRLTQMLAAETRPIDVEVAERILRDRYDAARQMATSHPTMNTVYRVDNQVGMVMSPASLALHAVVHLPRERFAAPATGVSPSIAHTDRAEEPTPSPAPSMHRNEKSVTSRYVLQMVERPLLGAGSPERVFAGRALILGHNAFAEALRSYLESAGAVVEILADNDITATLARIDAAWKSGPAPYLFLTTACDEDAATSFDAAHYADRRRRGVQVPYQVCQSWAKHVTDAQLWDDAVVVAFTKLGGEFGVTGDVGSVEGGALAGLLKALCIENWVQGRRRTTIRLLDLAASTTPTEAVAALRRELTETSIHMEIGWTGDLRRVARTRRAPLPRATERNAVRRGSAWVCTGGARGITALVARTLAREYGVRLHLLGTAPVPNIDPGWLELSEAGLKALRNGVMRDAQAAGKPTLKTWQDVEKAIEIEQTLRKFAAEGIAAEYHSCDVADRASLHEVLCAIRARGVPIEGVLHGAGFGKDSRFDRKEMSNVEKCFRAKNDGAAHLMDLTREDPLRHFIGFGSISGRFGANGHTDYSAANDMLAKQIDWFRKARPDCRSATFHWHAWDDVGMATKPETRLALEMVNMVFMPAREGVEHLLNELEAGLPDAEVMITTDAYRNQFQPDDAHHRLDHDLSEVDGEFRASLDPTKDRFLLDHRLDDHPLLPVVVGLELLAEGARSISGVRPTVFRNVEALQGLKFADDRSRAACVKRISNHGEPPLYALQSDVRTRDGKLVEAGRTYLRGVVEASTLTLGRDATIAVPPASEGRPVEYLERPARFYLGPSLRSLQMFWSTSEAAWGRVVAPPLEVLAGAERGAKWIVPSAVLDACLYAVGLWAWENIRPGTALPKSFATVRLGRLPRTAESCLVRAECREKTATEAVFDFVLYGDDGDILIDVEGYRVVWLGA
ncbi:MAG: hypothetical protein C0483_10045 [Pirellula sp.]|nr:hypothetical protein [Pirellula sp.]